MRQNARLNRKIQIRNSKFKKISLFVATIITAVLLAFLGLWAYFVFFAEGSKEIVANPFVAYASPDDIILSVKEKGYAIESVKVYEAGSVVKLKLKDGPEVFFAVNNSFTLQLEAMEQVIKRFSIDKKTPKTIDLRFDKPIVKL